MEGSGVAAGDVSAVGGGLSDTRSIGGGNGIGVAVCAWGRGECASCPPKYNTDFGYDPLPKVRDLTRKVPFSQA